MSQTTYAQPGHNVGGLDSTRLRSIVERHERLEEEVKTLRSDQKDILTEAKSAGFDAKILRQLLRLRKKDEKEIQEEEDMLDTYKRAMGMK